MSRKNKHAPAKPKSPVLCDYCGERARLVSGAVIYPHRQDLSEKRFWQCAPCKAYVGCHPHTSTPLGRLADAKLRRAKSAAHAAFDPIWRSKRMSRKGAYLWLSERLGIASKDCHIGMFDADQCARVISICTEEDA